MKFLNKVFFFTLIAALLSSCISSKNNSSTEAVDKNLYLSDLSGKWIMGNTSNYLILEGATNKMLLKTSCGIVTGNYTKINQAIIFNQLKPINIDCEISQNLIQNLRKITYYKLVSKNIIVLYDEEHQEKMRLNLTK